MQTEKQSNLGNIGGLTNRAWTAEEIKKEAHWRQARKTEKQSEVAPRPLQEGHLRARDSHRGARGAGPTLGSRARDPCAEEKESCYIWQRKSAQILYVCMSGTEVSWKSRHSPVGCIQLSSPGIQRRDSISGGARDIQGRVELWGFGWGLEGTIVGAQSSLLV